MFRITTLIGERGAGRVVVSKDGTNAYNRTERNSAVNFTAETFPTTERWVKWLYGTASFLRTTERLAVALAHANSFIVEEASLKAINPRATASQIYRGLSKLGR